MVILVSSSSATLSAVIDGKRSATVEAEYGNLVVEGSVITLAHHSPAWAHNKSPCTRKSEIVPELEVIGLSHLDLDSIGGALSLLGAKPGHDEFWELVGWIDIRGAHRLAQAIAEGHSPDDVRRLNAWWAWWKTHHQEVPRDGSVKDVTVDVTVDAATALDRIVNGDGTMLSAGDAFAKDGEELNKSSFVKDLDGVILRTSGQFTNYLYVTPDGRPCKAVVAMNTKNNAITVSLADPIEGVSCREVVQSMWGPEAGGHTGIAGSPRGKAMTMEDTVLLWTLMRHLVTGS